MNVAFKTKLSSLYGNTSKGTKHLGEEHLLIATKVTVENERKRSRAEQLDRIRNVVVTGDDSRRINLLLETMLAVNNNLPFRIGEYEESELLADFTLGDAFRVTINNHVVTRLIAEVYSSARTSACDYIDRSGVVGVPTFTVVCDMLASKTQKSTKYIGLRLYFVDSEWKFQSILLGTRHYEHM
ncbi:hypothetical protein GN958_ATG00353 [Phytophthora infestans]|uniref:Uncharacterized protein n=1 Tax=Phytophthora infestans TaxID=4787 RepID=A0A8S9VCB0_PHYIN|nr:hypothetical protein GN958_ATG00353 [Phytophthora infestans]